MKRQHKIRRIEGEIINTSEIAEKKAGCMKNFGIFMRYDTRTCTVNMYKEYRDVTLCGAVSQLYLEMSGRHSARWETIQVIKTSVVEASALKRQATSQFADRSIRFPKVYTVKRAPTQQLKTIFSSPTDPSVSPRCTPSSVPPHNNSKLSSRPTDPPSSERVCVVASR